VHYTSTIELSNSVSCAFGERVHSAVSRIDEHMSTTIEVPC